VIGLLSLADLALEAVLQTAGNSPELTVAEIGRLLAAISQPREKES
jgi:hypothetical protein